MKKIIDLFFKIWELLFEKNCKKCYWREKEILALLEAIKEEPNLEFVWGEK